VVDIDAVTAIAQIRSYPDHELVLDGWEMLSGRIMCRQDGWHGSHIDNYESKEDVQVDFDRHVRVMRKKGLNNG